ncbi:TatD family hydrolase [Candidatus Saccharibacteria bacterium]|nr:TatD family hydrolase [Candidatus Saccharibacteria bacterium]
MLVDTHCHIHGDDYSLPVDEVIQRANEAGVKKLICIGTTIDDSKKAVKFASGYDNVFASIGVHPHDSRHGVDLIAELASSSNKKIVAIGEIGLDYYYLHSPKSDQVLAFEKQLQIARDAGLPVVFHVRDAFDDFWPIVDNFSGLRGVLHSFTDKIEHMERGLAKGFYVGLNGISTFTRDESQKEMFLQIPLERLLLETDAPFLTPRPFRGKVNEPARVREVAEYHAAARGLRLDDLAIYTTRNAETLFGIQN